MEGLLDSIFYFRLLFSLDLNVCFSVLQRMTMLMIFSYYLL